MFQHFDLIPVKGLQAYETENWLVCKKDKNEKNAEYDGLGLLGLVWALE